MRANIDLMDVRPGTPIWRRVQFAIERDIEAGVYGPGERLPGEEEFATKFGVHRHTVRRALHRLEEKELVRAEQGRGTFVQEPKVAHDLGATSQFSTTIQNLHRTATREVIGVLQTKADKLVAAALEHRVGNPVVMVETLRRLDGRPVGFTSAFYELPRFAGIETIISETGSVSKALASYGVRHYTQRFNRISARSASRRDALLLEQPTTRPILQIDSIGIDEDGKPVQFARARFASNWVEIVVRHPGP